MTVSVRNRQLAAQQARRRMISAAIAFVIIVVLAASAVIILDKFNLPNTGQTANSAGQSAPLNIETMPDEGAVHVEMNQRVNYQAYSRGVPPTSGSHYPQWAQWKYFDDPISPEFFVHNLEHGGIVVLLNCSTDCSTEKQMLHDAYTFLKPSKYGYPKLLVTPYANLKTKYALLAWDKLLQTDRLDRPMLEQFYNMFVDRGPEDAG